MVRLGRVILSRRWTIVFFTAMLLLVATACTSSGRSKAGNESTKNHASTTVASTTVASTGSTALPGSAKLKRLPAPRPFKLTKEGVQQAMRRWISAYNRRNAKVFLSYFSDKRVNAVGYQGPYGGCDYATGTFRSMKNRAAVLRWIQGRWTLGDHLKIRSVSVANRNGKIGGPVKVAVIGVRRTSSELPHGANEGIKVVFDRAGTDHLGLIGVAAMAGNTSCSQG